MKSVNKIVLLGNVTRDAELKSTTSGRAVCTFGLATNRTWKDSKGEKKVLPEFHNMVAWGGLAELCEKTVKKGSPLYVEGYVKTSSWEGKEKQKVSKTEVVIENLVFLGARPEGAPEEEPAEATPADEE